MVWEFWDSTPLSGSFQTSAASLLGEIFFRNLPFLCLRFLIIDTLGTAYLYLSLSGEWLVLLLAFQVLYV